jgi:hypothetical protein
MAGNCVSGKINGCVTACGHVWQHNLKYVANTNNSDGFDCHKVYTDKENPPKGGFSAEKWRLGLVY